MNSQIKAMAQPRAAGRSARLARGTALVALALSLAGCMSFGSGPRPLPATPTTPVASTALPQPVGLPPAGQSLPADGTLADAAPDQPMDELTLDTPVETASAPTSGAAVSEDDLIGAWSASTPAATCAINLSLTSWTGGYRASTRNCGDIQLATLSAWAVEGQQVTLKGADGAMLARLYRTGDTRYSGQLESGQAITVFR